MKTSIFEIFKIGIGPSSSHTVGPMRAAREFAVELQTEGVLARVARIRIELFGSLALTGRGHCTDKAIQLGLLGGVPEEVDPCLVAEKLSTVRNAGRIRLLEAHEVSFEADRDLVFLNGQSIPGHSNAMRFTAFDEAGGKLASSVFHSIGGGFISRPGRESETIRRATPPFPFANAAELLQFADDRKLSIWEIMLENEKTWRSEASVRSGIDRIWRVMQDCTERGVRTDGALPGGLNVQRRAARMRARLEEQSSPDPLAPLDWVNAYAIAVGEENAAGGRVVTAPTNGAAGIIPAVAQYYSRFVPGSSEAGIFRFFLTAGAIGTLYTENASISGAEVGCQGEVGVACSMAAGALAAALGGTNLQVEYAAEIAMEHNLGMTCDPIGGLVQIPCIERNAMAAVKAINACRIALGEEGEHKVSLDQVIATMYQTGLDMQSRYKETSLAGLAVIKC
jgi:L-serine dehydratase